MGSQERVNRVLPMARFLLSTVTPAERKACAYLVENPVKVARMTLVEFAQESKSSQPSIIRLCKRIGVSGYTELKSNLAVQLAEEGRIGFDFDFVKANTFSSDIVNTVDLVLQGSIRILHDMLAQAKNDYDHAVEVLLKTKRIQFIAIGDGMVPCKFAYFKFLRLGYDCVAESDPDLMVVATCNLRRGDVAIAISHTGNSRLVNDALKIAHENGATTICITSREHSPMVANSDIVLLTGTADTTISLEVVARRIAEQTILEALYYCVEKYLEPNSLAKLRAVSDALKVNKIKAT
jgi:DNA-binding MurR/RpiR family transcriptional regulator